MIRKDAPFDKTVLVLVNRHNLWGTLTYSFLLYGFVMGMIYFFFAKGLLAPGESANKAIAALFSIFAFLGMGAWVRLVLTQLIVVEHPPVQQNPAERPLWVSGDPRPPYPPASDEDRAENLRQKRIGLYGSDYDPGKDSLNGEAYTGRRHVPFGASNPPASTNPLTQHTGGLTNRSGSMNHPQPPEDSIS